MAIDTAAKRKSLVGYGMPFRLALPAPDGAILAPDRLHLVGLYSGIAARGPATPPGFARLLPAGPGSVLFAHSELGTLSLIAFTPDPTLHFLETELGSLLLIGAGPGTATIEDLD